MIINILHQFISLLLFALMQKVTKKIKAVLKSYDFAKAPAARKKTRPSCVGTQTVFRLTRLHFRKIGISIRPLPHCYNYFRLGECFGTVIITGTAALTLLS